MTEDIMIKLAEEKQQRHSYEVMRNATNRADAKRKVAEKERETIKTRVSNCMEWIIRKLEKADMAEVKKNGKARGRGKSNKNPSGAEKRKMSPAVAASSTTINTAVDVKSEHMGRIRNIDLGSMMNKYGISREDLLEFMLSAPDSSGINDPPMCPFQNSVIREVA